MSETSYRELLEKGQSFAWLEDSAGSRACIEGDTLLVISIIENALLDKHISTIKFERAAVTNGKK